MEVREEYVWAAAFALELREMYSVGLPHSKGLSYDEYLEHRKQWERNCAESARNAADFAVSALRYFGKVSRKRK